MAVRLVWRKMSSVLRPPTPFYSEWLSEKGILEERTSKGVTTSACPETLEKRLPFVPKEDTSPNAVQAVEE